MKEVLEYVDTRVLSRDRRVTATTQAATETPDILKPPNAKINLEIPPTIEIMLGEFTWNSSSMPRRLAISSTSLAIFSCEVPRMSMYCMSAELEVFSTTQHLKNLIISHWGNDFTCNGMKWLCGIHWSCSFPIRG
jgi:hypothetical protein